MPDMSREKKQKRKASVSPEDRRRDARQLPRLTISSPSDNNSPAPVGRKVRPSGPNNVVEEDPVASYSLRLGGNLTSLLQEHTESDDGDDRSTSSAGSSTDGFLLPTRFRYTLYVTCLGHSTIRKEGHLYWNDPNSPRHFEESARKLAEEASGESDEAKVITFRHGFCTIEKGMEGVKHRLGLTSRNEWKRLCTTLVKDYDSESDESYELDIYYEYFELRARPDETDETPFPDIKRWELNALMKINVDERQFISNADLQKYTSEQMVRAIVTNDPCWKPSPNPVEIEQLIQDILQKPARKLLAMCVYAQINMKCLKKLIDVQQHYDGDLPLIAKKCCKRHGRYQEVLSKYHGTFQAAAFNIPGENQDMPSWVVAPVIPIDANRDGMVVEEGSGNMEGVLENPITRSLSPKDRAMIGFGSHGWVYRVKLDPYHHKLSDDRDAEFALKEFRATGSDVKYGRESDMLQLLRLYSHPHLTTHLVTWTHGGKYYMLFPLATCNLHEYMKKYIFEQTKKKQIWLLEQFCGLASALQRIHDLTFANSDSNLRPNPLHQEKERRAGWHHDLKPENILYFENTHLKHKVFQIADFGSSKIHIMRSRSHPTRTPRGTLTYEPPEMETEGETSRPYDVWSLGCVFLELLVWAVMGYTSLEKFKTDRISRRTSEGVPDDGFWKRHSDGTVALRNSVLQWIARLRKKIEDQPQQPFKELLDVITFQMLEIDRTKRIVASDVYLDTKRILAQQEAVLAQGADAFRPDSKGSELSPVALLPQSSLANSSRRSSTARSFSDAGPSLFKNQTMMSDVEYPTASPSDHISPFSIHPPPRRGSSASELLPSTAIRSRATSNASTSGHSPLNPNAPRHEGLSPTSLRPPSSSRPSSSHSAPATLDEEK